MAQHFHADGLRSVCACLDLSELPSVSSACLAWRDALYKERSRQVLVDHLALSQIPQLALSPLRHHVRALYVRVFGEEMFDLSAMESMNALPSLKELSIQLSGDALWDAALLASGGGVSDTGSAAIVAAGAAVIGRSFPRSVTRLTLKLVLGNRYLAVLSQKQQLVCDIACGQPQLSELTMDLDRLNSHHVDVDVAGLRNLCALRHLTLHWRLTVRGVRELRQIASLESLKVADGAGWSDELLDVLTDPAQCKLSHLRLLGFASRTLTAAGAQSLARLPALEELRPWCISSDALPHLTSLSALTSLHLRVAGTYGGDRGWVVTPASFVLPHLSGCARLTSIAFQSLSFAEADLQALVQALPQMQKCTFDQCELASLAALTDAVELRHLGIRRSNLCAADVLPLSAVSRLCVMDVQQQQLSD
jgi:hypothetical protein